MPKSQGDRIAMNFSFLHKFLIPTLKKPVITLDDQLKSKVNAETMVLITELLDQEKKRMRRELMEEFGVGSGEVSDEKPKKKRKKPTPTIAAAVIASPGEESAEVDVELNVDAFRLKWKAEVAKKQMASREVLFQITRTLIKTAPCQCTFIEGGHTFRKRMLVWGRQFDQCIEHCHSSSESSFFLGKHSGKTPVTKPSCNCIK